MITKFFPRLAGKTVLCSVNGEAPGAQVPVTLTGRGRLMVRKYYGELETVEFGYTLIIWLSKP